MSMSDRDGLIWFDGKMVPWREANVHVLTHTLHYGMGVFEGVRAYNTDQGAAIFRLPEHTDRLFNSAKIMNMQIPFSKEEISTAQLVAVKENNLDSAYIRPMCFYGSEGMGLRADNLFTRHHVNISMCKAKANGHYINSMLALQEAMTDGYDEALLLDVEGFVAEGSGENIFVIKDGVIYTPDLTSALNGITRNTIMTFANDLNYELVEKRITRDEIYIADEAFFSGTAAEVTPIRELDNRPIGDGTRGPITEKLQSLYFDVVHGKVEKYKHWLTVA